MSTPSNENAAPTLNSPKKSAEDEQRERKHEMEKFKDEIEQKIDICHQLSETIEHEKKKLHSLRAEKKFRSQRLEEITAQYHAIMDKNNASSKNQVTEIKTQIIKEKLEELLAQKIPEAGLKTNKLPKDDSADDNEFKNLIHDNIKIIYTKYETATAKTKNEEEKNFKISSKSIFSTLKAAACDYWRIENPNDYSLTDDSEAIIYYEDMKVNDYMKDYSVRTNIFRLINTNLLKARTKIIPLQEDTLKEVNNFKSRAKNEIRNRQHGNSTHVINNFIGYFSGLKPYFLDKRKNADQDQQKKIEAGDWDSSFIMLLLTILFFSFTLAVIFRGERNTLLYNKNKAQLMMDYKDTDSSGQKGYQLIGSIDFIIEKVKEKKCYKNNKIGIDPKSEELADCTKKFYSRKSRESSGYETITTKMSSTFGNKYKNENSHFQKGGDFRIDFDTEAGHFDGSGFHGSIITSDQ